MQLDFLEPPATRPKPVNLLTHNRTYEGIGQTSTIAAKPAVLHFSGFTPGQTAKQAVQLCNVSNHATRVHVVSPDSDYFKVTHVRSQGSIAPGMQEQLVVEFTSEQLRYHYDCIRVQTEGGGLLIPLHAYPVMNEVQLAKWLDLGKVALGTSTTQQLQLSCKVPLDFDFSVYITKHNRAFTVTPMSGTVPANGSTAITITFTPATLTTEELQLQVLVSEFNAKPMPVTVTGSAAPGLARDQVLAAALGSSSPLQQQRKLTPASATRNKGGGTIRGGAGGGDAYTVEQQLRRNTGSNSTISSSTGQPATLLPPLPNRRQPEVLVEGTYFPPTLSTQHDINCVLNQQPGKLRTKDIKTAIAGRKRELQLEQQVLEAVLAAGAAAGLDPLDQPSTTPAIKEALFQLQLQQADANAKHCTGLVGSQGQVLGQDPPSPNTIERLKAVRQAMLDQHVLDKQEAASHRLELEVLQSGALHVLQQLQQQQQGGTGNSNCSNSCPCYPGLENFTPQWWLLETNEWRKRVQVTQRFVNAVRVVMYRNRAQARIHKLKALGARLHGNKERMAGIAVQEVVLESTIVQRPGLEPTHLLLPERVQLVELPVYRPAKFAQHKAVEPTQYRDFMMLQQQPYKAEFEYKLLGYAPEEYPGLIPYLPPCKDQPLMVGAGEEATEGLPIGLLPTAVTDHELEAMPEGLSCSPFASLEMGSRYTNEQVFVPMAPRWGCEPDCLLQPCQYRFHDSAAQEVPGSSGVRALAAAPLQAHTWLPLQNPWMAGGMVELPKLMSGADPAHNEQDAQEDADKPQLPIRVPDVQLYPPATAMSSLSDATTVVALPLVRRQHQLENNQMKMQQRDEALNRLTSSAQLYNQQLARPHRLAIKH